MKNVTKSGKLISKLQMPKSPKIRNKYVFLSQIENNKCFYISLKYLLHQFIFPCIKVCSCKIANN